MTTVAAIPPIVTVDKICELLQISRTQFFLLRARGWFGGDGPALIEVLPAVDRKLRYRGEPFAKWLDAKTQARLFRDQLRDVAGIR